MEDNSQQLNNLSDLNNVNNSQVQDLGNITPKMPQIHIMNLNINHLIIQI